jgi:hypothetical protein
MDAQMEKAPDLLDHWMLHERILFLPKYEDRAEMLTQLGHIWFKHWDTSEREDHLIQVVAAFEDAVRHDGQNIAAVGALALALNIYCTYSGDEVDIIRAVDINRQAVDLTLKDDPDLPQRLNNFAASLRARFNKLKDTGDLNEMICLQRDAFRHIPHGHPDWIPALSSLGESLLTRFQRLGNIEDLSESISRLQEGLTLVPNGHSETPQILSLLGIGLRERYGQRDDISDLNDSVSQLEEAVFLTPDSDIDRPRLQSNLAKSLHYRFDRLGNLHDFDKCIGTRQDAVNEIVDDHPYKPVIVNGLGISLLERFILLGDRRDINNSISTMEDTLQEVPADHPEKPSMLHNLVHALKVRFEQFGDHDDLANCISKQREAVDLTPNDHPGKPGMLSHLGNCLQIRFSRFGDFNALNESISKQEDAIFLSQETSPTRPKLLTHLGMSLVLRSQARRPESLSDIQKAVSIHREALAQMPDTNPEKALLLGNLATALMIRFDHLRHQADLDESILKNAEIVELIPDHDPDSPGWLNNFAAALARRYWLSKKTEDLHATILQYRRAACQITGSATKRFHAASQWAHYAQIEPHPSLLEAYDVAVGLLPGLAWLGLSIADRQHQIMQAGPVVRDAAAAAICAGECSMAVQWLEQGRSIIWGQLLNLRTPIDALKDKHPKLANELTFVSAQLERATIEGRNSEVQLSLKSIAGNAHRNALRREDLLKEIRTLDGFQQFLRPKPLSELSAAAQMGPVILLNVSRTSCDALALLPGLREEVVYIPLPESTPEDVKSLAQSFGHLKQHMGRADRLYGRIEGGSAGIEDDFSSILSELWLRLVKPILNALEMPAMYIVGFCTHLKNKTGACLVPHLVIVGHL